MSATPSYEAMPKVTGTYECMDPACGHTEVVTLLSLPKYLGCTECGARGRIGNMKRKDG